MSISGLLSFYLIPSANITNSKTRGARRQMSIFRFITALTDFCAVTALSPLFMANFAAQAYGWKKVFPKALCRRESLQTAQRQSGRSLRQAAFILHVSPENKTALFKMILPRRRSAVEQTFSINPAHGGSFDFIPAVFPGSGRRSILS